MANTVKAKSAVTLSIVEKLVDAAGTKTNVKHAIPFTKKVLTATTTPAVSGASSGVITLTAAQVALLNLKALAHPNGSTLNFHGLKLTEFALLVLSGSVTLGADAGLVIGAGTLLSGDLLLKAAITTGSAISDTNKTITITCLTNCEAFWLLAVGS